MNLLDIANQTLEIIDRGVYQAPSGRTVDLREQIAFSVNGTMLYRPHDFADLSSSKKAKQESPCVEVSEETSAEAGRRLVLKESYNHVVALNFASARNPGGGFLNGARAQEEDLARCSALYPCLLQQMEYYNANHEEPSALYTDHIIYSPAVPFFRGEDLSLLETPFPLSIITAPAPNAGEMLKKDPNSAEELNDVLYRRAGCILRVAADKGHKILILGAWGCGVFRNNAVTVAEAFATWLDSEEFSSSFDKVVFAIWDKSASRPTLTAFQRRFQVQ